MNINDVEDAFGMDVTNGLNVFGANVNDVDIFGMDSIDAVANGVDDIVTGTVGKLH